MINSRGEFEVVGEGGGGLMSRRRKSAFDEESTLRDFGKRVLGSRLSASSDKTTRNHFQRVLPETPSNGFLAFHTVNINL
jgi:hypothetical protein